MCCNITSSLSFSFCRSLFLKDEALNDQESLTSAIKPASWQHSMTKTDEEHFFDLE